MALRMCSRDVISLMHCRTSLKLWQSCDVIKATSVQPAFFLFSGVPNLFSSTLVSISKCDQIICIRGEGLGGKASDQVMDDLGSYPSWMGTY